MPWWPRVPCFQEMLAPGATTNQHQKRLSLPSELPLPRTELEGTRSSTGYRLPEPTDWKSIFYNELPWFLALKACLCPPSFFG